MSQFPKVSIRFPRVLEVQSINFFDVFPDDTKVVNVSTILKEIWMSVKSKTEKEGYNYYSDLLHKKYTNFKFYINGKRNPPLGFIRDVQNITKELNINLDLNKLLGNVNVKFGHGGNAATAQLPMVMTPELAYLIGAMRDGTIARCGKYEISYSQKNREWLKIIQYLLIKTFNPSNKPIIRNDRVTLSNRPIFEYYHRIFKIPVGNKIKWGTPKIIETSGMEIKRCYIRGFYDADGLSWKLGFCQANKQAIVFVKNTLEKLGIETSKLLVVSKKNKKTMYYLNTHKKSHVDFIKLIGSLNPSKQKLFPST